MSTISNQIIPALKIYILIFFIYFLSIYGFIYCIIFSGHFLVSHFFPKVKREMDFGHFKNVHIGISGKSFEKEGLKWAIAA
jgi:hypothetical protein